MGSIDWDREEALLARLLELSARERAAFLEREGITAPRAAELLALVERELAATSFLEAPAPLITNGELELRPGSLVGRYRLERPIGRGGMGAVWLAERDGDFRQRVAVKLLGGGLVTREARERFTRERQVLAELEHPGIARLIDGGELRDGRPYLVMEYVDGTPIDAFCEERRLTIRERVELFLPVLDAVQYAHGRLVVHRDLKPSNILVQAEGTPKLLDFGIAKVLAEEDDRLTRTHARPMTPRYASPEQVEGKTLTTGSDVYALGVLLYELLTGLSPYGDTTSTLALMRAVCELEPPAPSAVVERLTSQQTKVLGAGPQELRRALSGDLDWITRTALHKDLQRRYASPDHLAADLRRHLAGQPVHAGPDTWRYRTVKFARRNLLAVSSLAAAGLVLLFATVFSTVSAVHAGRAEAVERATRGAAEETLTYLSRFLLAADGVDGLGRDARVADMLAQARADAASLEDLEVSVAVHCLLGQTFLNLGDEVTAEAELLLAIRQCEGHEVAQGYLVTAYNQLGKLYMDTLRPAQARVAFRDSLARLDLMEDAATPSLLEAILPEGIEQRLVILGNFASALSLSGRSREAVESYREILRDGPGRVGPLLLATTRSNLAGSLADLGLLGEARDEAQRALEELVRLTGPDGWETILAAAVLADTQLLLGRPTEAEELLAAYVPYAEAVIGPQALVTRTLRSQRGEALARVGRPEEGERLVRAARAASSEAFDIIVDLERHLGVCLLEQGRLDEAAYVFSRWASIEEARVSPTNFGLGVAIALEGDCLARMQRPGEARACYRRALETDLGSPAESNALVLHVRGALAALEAHGGSTSAAPLPQPSPPSVLSDSTEAVVERHHAVALTALGRQNEALELLDRVIAWQEQHHGPRDLVACVARFDRANALLGAGRDEEALKAFEDARDRVIVTQGQDSPLAMIMAGQIGIVLSLVGRPEEGLAFLEHLAPARAVGEVLEDGDWIWPFELARAWVLSELGSYEECEALALELQARPMDDDPVLGLILRQILARCLAGSGRVKRALELQAELLPEFERLPPGELRPRGLLHRDFAESLAAAGRFEPASEQFDRAIELFEELGGEGHRTARETRDLRRGLVRGTD